MGAAAKVAAARVVAGKDTVVVVKAAAALVVEVRVRVATEVAAVAAEENLRAFLVGMMEVVERAVVATAKEVVATAVVVRVVVASEEVVRVEAAAVVVTSAKRLAAPAPKWRPRTTSVRPTASQSRRVCVLVRRREAADRRAVAETAALMGGAAVRGPRVHWRRRLSGRVGGRVSGRMGGRMGQRVGGGGGRPR
jgi:hypothetical protein